MTFNPPDSFSQMQTSTAPTASPLPTVSNSVSPRSHKLSSSTASRNDHSHKSDTEIPDSSPNEDHEPTDDAQPNSNDNDTFMPEGLPLSKVCVAANTRVQHFLDEWTEDRRLQAVQEQVRKSLDIIEEALERYSLSELSLSYNGGKDCLVLLILYLCAVHRKGALARQSQQPQPQRRRRSQPQPQHQVQPQAQAEDISWTSSDTNTSSSTTITHLQSVYIQAAHPFPSVEHFVTQSSVTYNLSLTRLWPPMKSAFATYLASHPTRISAIFVGTRRTDPHGSDLKPFQRTDHGWPDFERIHPVLEWRYVEIWTFIRHLNIPYCPLYDAGYTSLGGTNDTYPNPALRIDSGIFSSLGDDEDDDDNNDNNDNKDGISNGTPTTTTVPAPAPSPSPSPSTALYTSTPPDNSKLNSTLNSDLYSTSDSDSSSHHALSSHIQNDNNTNNINHVNNSATHTYKYRPAYDLQDDALERLGRDRNRNRNRDR